LREKERDGTWDKQFWVKEQGEAYLIDPMTDET
jgi:hypothetical protein